MLKPESSLDPKDWPAFRALAHAALDDALDLVANVREFPVWQPVPPAVKENLTQVIPLDPTPIAEVYAQFRENILPYATGNIHPRFFGWVHGAGLAGGIVAEMMAAAMNSNCGGRDHGAIYVERQVIDWVRQLFDFPRTSSGLLVSGTSLANLIGLGVARSVQPGGLDRLTAYASAEAHESVFKSFELLGLRTASLRAIPVDHEMRMDVGKLSDAIAADRLNGLTPFCVVGTAGTVNTGAIDDLAAIAQVCSENNLWLHVDGAFGALCVLSDSLSSRLAGMERADSIAFDFHKWGQVQYDAGCILVRDGDAHRATYSSRPPYLMRAARGLSGGDDWPCEFGPELSRGFRALKIWFALKEHGTRGLGRIVEQNCAQATYLRERIAAESELELVAPGNLNIVCFRYGASDAVNEDIVADLQLSGVAAPSTTRIRGSLAIRVNITNHRTRREDLDILLDAVLTAGRARAPEIVPNPPSSTRY